jgi:hypothetical protein
MPYGIASMLHPLPFAGGTAILLFLPNPRCILSSRWWARRRLTLWNQEMRYDQMRCKASRQGRRIRLVATSPRRRLLLSCDPTLRRVELGRGRDPRGRRNFGCECRWSVGNGVSLRGEIFRN